MTDTVRIRLSLGLVACLISLPVINVFLQSAVIELHEPTCHEPTAWTVPPRLQTPVSHYGVQKLEQPSSVNIQAQGELKQGELKQGGQCLPCQQPQSRVFHQPVYRPAVNSQPVYMPASNHVATPAPAKPYQIALFVTGDQKSNVMLHWFQSDPQIMKLREHCDFQIYTPQSVMYQARYRDIIPVEQFPVMLFQDKTGGHIHAAGKSMIPATAGELVADMRKGFDLYVEAKQATKPGALKTAGYSWDDAINPAMRLSDCPDGNCPNDSEPGASWRPGNRQPGSIFDGANDAKSAFMWANVSEIAVVGVIVLLGCMIGFILVRRVT